MSIEQDIISLADNAKTCSWLSGYGAVSELVQLTGARSILEVGVAYGYHALHVIEACPDIEYVGLDPYVANYDPDDQFSRDVSQLFPVAGTDGLAINQSMDRLHSAVVHTLNRRSKSASIERNDFFNFSKQNRKRTFDLIYVDGNHTEEYVFSDTILSALHLAKNGLICGDDIERQSVQIGLAKAAKILKLDPKFYKHRNGKVLWILNKL